jgi:GNAT superfamily N-acetyltransferase
MNKELVIRPYRSSDLSACRELYLQLVQQHRDIYDDPTIGESDPYSGLMNQLRDHGEESLWVAEIEGNVIGLVGLIVKGDEAEIEPIIVAESHRRRGIGTQLLKHVTQVAREAEAKFLNVKHAARNWQAIQCSHAAGFRTLGFIELFQDLRGDFKAASGPEILGMSFDW